MGKDMLRCSLVAILLIVGSVDAWAQSAARQSDALLDLLLWGIDRGIDISASISPRRMPVSRAAMIIDRRCGDATASKAASSASLILRRRLLSSSSIRISTSVPRRKGVRSRYSRPTAQLSM